MSKPPLPSLAALIPPGNYIHYKGGQYHVLGAAYFEATLEPMVVYVQVSSGEMFVRPYEEFIGTVDTEHGSVARFQLRSSSNGD